MSRRKQGRPQQRKAIDSVERENDLLICGDCNANFPLQDILKFIRHKINRCDKENVDLESPDPDDGDQSDSETMSVGGNFKTSISAPISKKDMLDSKLTSHRSLEYLKDALLIARKAQEDDINNSRFPLKPKTVNAETNTSSSEPLRLVCECCSAIFGSAWSLLQHSQKEHKMRLYRDEINLSPTPPKQQKLLEAPHKDHTNNRPSPILNPNSPHHHRRPQSHRSDGDIQERHEYGESKDREQLLTQALSQEQHRTPSTASSIGSTESGHGPHPHRQSPQNIFMNAFRFPFDRHSLSPSMPFPRLPGTEFPPMTSEAALHMTQRGLLGFPPNIFEHGRPFPSMSGMFEPRPRLSPASTNPMDNQDFYSKRLKELARGPPSPVSRRQTPPFSQPTGQVPSPLFSPLNSGSNPPSEPPQKEQPSGNVTPMNKLKSCEFCGKSFRFQSNLIVHRRSHTGEKPFKCPLCPHACTQQSKLKRHMKTHQNKSSGSSNGGDGQIGSGNSTPDSRGVYIDRDDENEDDDMDEEEEEEAEEEDDEREEEEEEEESQSGLSQEKRRDQTEEASEQNNSTSGLKLELDTPDSNSESKPHEIFNKSSLLKEVIRNSGFNNLSVYSDALKQAMAETIKTENSERKAPSENGSSISNGNANEDSKDEGGNRSSSRPPSDSENELKSVKREPESPMLNNYIGMENIFSPVWGVHPPPPEFFPLLPTSFPRFDRDPNHNNFNPSPESALKSLNQGLQKTGRPVTEEMNGLGPNARKEKRNDTCEFCGKVFKNCSNLTVHRRSHTGEKPYKCELCSYACAQSSKLTRHMKTHGRVGKDVYRCKFCAMPFSVASTLEKHMRKCVEKCQGRALPDTDSDTNEGSDRGGAASHISSPLLPSSSHAALLGGSPVPTSAGNPSLSILGSSGSPVPPSVIATSVSPLLSAAAGNPALTLGTSSLLGGSVLPPSTIASSQSPLLSSHGSPALSLANSSATTNA